MNKYVEDYHGSRLVSDKGSIRCKKVEKDEGYSSLQILKRPSIDNGEQDRKIVVKPSPLTKLSTINSKIGTLLGESISPELPGTTSIPRSRYTPFLYRLKKYGIFHHMSTHFQKIQK